MSAYPGLAPTYAEAGFASGRGRSERDPVFRTTACRYGVWGYGLKEMFGRLSLPAMALAALCAALPARAEGGPELRYSAPAGCPPAAEFQRAVRARLKSDTKRWPTTTFEVEISRQGASSVAELVFLAADGTPVRRSVEGDGCAQAVDAIALITALAIDAWVEQRLREEAEKQAEPAPAVEPPPPKAAEPEPPRAEPPDAPEAPPRPLAIETGVGFRASSPHGPQVSFGGDVFVGMRAEAPWPLAARVGFAYESTGNVEVRDGTQRIGEARFDWMAAQLEACPIFFRLSDAVLLDLCAQIQAGAIFVSTVPGSGLAAMDSSPAFWAGAEALGRVQLAPASLFRIEAYGGVVIPFHSGSEGRSFVVDCGAACSEPELEVFRIPVIGWSAGARVALAFH